MKVEEKKNRKLFSEPWIFLVGETEKLNNLYIFIYIILFWKNSFQNEYHS